MRIVLFASLALAALTSLPTSALGAPREGRDLFGVQKIIPDSELSHIRGGFIVNGVDVSLGAQMQTFINGQLVLTTTVNWGPDGRSSTTTAASSLVQASSAFQQALLSGGSVGNGISGAQVYLANNGQTALWQGTTNGLQSGLLNTTNGLVATQTINANVGLSGNGGFAAANLANSLGQALGVAVGSSVVR